MTSALYFPLRRLLLSKTRTHLVVCFHREVPDSGRGLSAFCPDSTQRDQRAEHQRILLPSEAPQSLSEAFLRVLGMTNTGNRYRRSTSRHSRHSGQQSRTTFSSPEPFSWLEPSSLEPSSLSLLSPVLSSLGLSSSPEPSSLAYLLTLPTQHHQRHQSVTTCCPSGTPQRHGEPLC